MAIKREKKFDTTKIGGRIADLRTKLNMTQDELAEKWGFLSIAKKSARLKMIALSLTAVSWLN